MKPMLPRSLSLTSALVLLSLAFPQMLRADAWPMKGHDTRRTGQSQSIGPFNAGEVQSYTATAGQSINIAATVSDAGNAYFGTWGVVRSYGSDDRTLWEKDDGQIYAVRGADAASLWSAPVHPEAVPYCYDYGDRADPAYCPDGGAVSWYNGTVEGSGVLSVDQKTLYIGRGDGRVFALDAATGARRWMFQTFNPEDVNDPDGGGEVIGGPLLTPSGVLYFATLKAGPRETNALYAVDAATGSLLWRYPSASASLSQIFFAAPVLSPDAQTVYVAGAWGPQVEERDPALPGTVYAFDAASTAGPGESRLKWQFNPTRSSDLGTVNIFNFIAAAGADGTLYVGGSEYTEAWGTAVVYALKDLGDHAAYAWPSFVDLDRNGAAMTYGLALRETNGATTTVYASSANGYGLGGYPSGGVLMALSPTDGAVRWTFDPSAHGLSGALSGIAIDADGTLFTGISGAGNSGGVVFSLSSDGVLLWRYTLGGLLEWGHPVLGPSGELFVSDTRRCFWAFEPIEDGLCTGTNIDPTLYVMRESTASGCGGRSGGAGAGCAAILMVGGLWSLVWRGRYSGRVRCPP